jgi:putative tryptophan/tyrosine transport system substrate-binding protein
MSDRRLFLGLALLSCAGVLAPVSAIAQPVRRIGILVPSAYGAKMVPEFSRRLAALGWIENRNLAIELRNAQGQLGRVPALAKELVDLKVDVLVTATTPVTRSALATAGSIPIVFTWVGDPVAVKFVASLARPGGRVTGVSLLQADLAGKQLEFLRVVVPGLARVAQLYNPKYAGGPMNAKYVEAAARAGISLVRVTVTGAADLEPAFAEAAREKASAMLVPPEPLYAEQGRRIAQLAKQFRMASSGQAREYAEGGGLISYGADYSDGFMRIAPYVDKILRGATPADLPVQLADRFELVVNRGTAKALGLTIPQSVLLQATEVIE